MEKETVCEKCPNGVGVLDAPDDMETVLPFVGHISYLNKLLEIGATVHLDDLSKAEWDGLILLKQVSSQVMDEHMKKEREKDRLKHSLSSSKRKR